MNVLRAFRQAEVWPIVLVAALGLVAVYLLLPRPRASARRLGTALGALALILAGVFIVRAGAATAETVLFYAFSAIALIAGGLLVTQANPARAALSFALVVLSTCGLFLLLAAPFLMAATVIIYAGAIIVTFLFVLMLAQQEGISDADQRSREPLLSAVTGFVLLGALLYVLQASYGTRDLDALLEKARQAASKEKANDIAAALGVGTDYNKPFFENFKAALRKGGNTAEARALEGELTNLHTEVWSQAAAAEDVAKMKEVLDRLEDIGRRARASYAVLQPDPAAPLSSASGPPANVPPFPAAGGDALRRDAAQRPEMPAENTAYLGRSLFTDYLLPVELGGTLLLVATIGAIAIAGRRGERRA
jgi:NADH:ubiquinone oxidoreductase subunit 6 (subunit J)